MKFNSNVQKDIQDRINYAVDKIKRQYLAVDNNLPWLIGYSGGKDSTCTAQLVFYALCELREENFELNRRVVIFSADTMIENPLIKEIIEKNIKLINVKANELNLPIEARILKPNVSKTFWVNVIGRGYPTPNTMFRWCTDRLKIEPANDFIHECINKSGEVIMVLGVREGESNTRDRVLKSHEIDGEVLMRHTTLTNAYIFAPIKHLTTIDVFTYLAGYESPWDSSNRELYLFYEESGGGDCPIFVSTQDKTKSNSCGNSRMGCWVCTVVSNDKSLTGFIETGFYDFLKPLLEFRNWLVSIRDDYRYRCHYRNNGSIYKKEINLISKDSRDYLVIPKKGNREKIVIEIKKDNKFFDANNKEYICINDDQFEEYLKNKNLNYKSPELEFLIIKDHITNKYYRLGAGPYTDEAKKMIFEKLIDTETKYNEVIDKKTKLISDAEIIEILKLWKKSGIPTSDISEMLIKKGRLLEPSTNDSFDEINEKYAQNLRKLLEKNGLDFKLVQKLLFLEKEKISKNDRKDIQDVIEKIFNSDSMSI